MMIEEARATVLRVSWEVIR